MQAWPRPSSGPNGVYTRPTNRGAGLRGTGLLPGVFSPVCVRSPATAQKGGATSIPPRRTLILMRSLLDFFGGLYQLTRLAVISRFRFKGPYWRWRLHTAFGRGYPASKATLIKSILDYGVWMHRMRRGRV